MSVIKQSAAKRLDKIIITVSFCYLLLPIVIFLFGWLKTGYAIGSTAILITALFKFLRNNDSFAEVEISRDSRHSWLVVVLIALAWVYFSGIGGFSFQNFDFESRNAILHDLINYHWPVIYDYTGQPAIHRLSGHRGELVYYLVFWLPSAIFGKLLGWNIANLFLCFYSLTGVLLFFYLLSRYLKKLSGYLALLFIFWSGLDLAGSFIFSKGFYIGKHIEWWAAYFQYSSHTTTLFWVFNQAIPAWIALLLILNQTNTKNIIFTYCLAFPFAPFPCIGLTPFVIYYVLYGKNESGTVFEGKAELFVKQRLMHIKGALSFQNIAAPLVIAFIFGTYYLSNSHSFGLNKLIFLDAGNFMELMKIILSYVLFCILEFGVISWLLAKQFRKEPLFIIAVISLIIIPWYQLGRDNDFAMRVSIPALIVLTIYTARWFIENENKNSFGKVMLLCYLIIGAITPANELIRSVQHTCGQRFFSIADHWKTFSQISKSKFKTKVLDIYIAVDSEPSFFFNKLAKLR